jgi:hypothetical protein
MQEDGGLEMDPIIWKDIELLFKYKQGALILALVIGGFLSLSYDYTILSATLEKRAVFFANNISYLTMFMPFFVS